jgi:hypothetical protein
MCCEDRILKYGSENSESIERRWRKRKNIARMDKLD